MENKELEKLGEETYKEIIEKSRIVYFIGILQTLCVLLMLSSIFFLIWCTPLLAFKIFISGLIGFLINGGIYLLIRKLAKREIKTIINKFTNEN